MWETALIDLACAAFHMGLYRGGLSTHAFVSSQIPASCPATENPRACTGSSPGILSQSYVLFLCSP